MIETLLVGMGTGLISGIVASGLIAAFTRCIKPKIVIADKIAMTMECGKESYIVKIVNLSRCYAKNVHITAYFVDRVNSGDDEGMLVKLRPLSLAKASFQLVDPYNAKDKEARYAIRLRFMDDLKTEWHDPEHTTLELTVSCENEINGVGKVFKKQYHMQNSMVSGIYKTGRSTDIIPY